MSHSATTNCDINSTYIDIFQRNNSQIKRQNNKDTEYDNQLNIIRKKFICYKCNKYPGDEDCTFGEWDDNCGRYTCFDCI
jgi:hypothetical protein